MQVPMLCKECNEQLGPFHITIRTFKWSFLVLKFNSKNVKCAVGKSRVPSVLGGAFKCTYVEKQN